MSISESDVDNVLHPMYDVMIQGIEDGAYLREIRRYKDGTYKELQKNQLFTLTKEYSEAEIDRITKGQAELSLMQEKITEFPLLATYLHGFYDEVQRLRHEKSKLIARNEKLSLEIQNLKARGLFQRIRRHNEAKLSDLMTQLKNISETGDNELPCIIY